MSRYGWLKGIEEEACRCEALFIYFTTVPLTGPPCRQDPGSISGSANDILDKVGSGTNTKF